MKLKKIISGGQTGAEQAALDAAVQQGIDHSGWTAKGRPASQAPPPADHQLRDLLFPGHCSSIEQNVIDSDGTALFSRGSLSEDCRQVQDFARKHDKPCVHVDLSQSLQFAAAFKLKVWLDYHVIEVLNVTGPSAAEEDEIYESVKGVLLDTLGMLASETEMATAGYLKKIPVWALFSRSLRKYPATVGEALDRLTFALPLKDKVEIAHLPMAAADALQHSIGRYIQQEFGLWGDNKSLLESSRELSGQADLDDDGATAFILTQLVLRLQKSHQLRVVK